VQDVLACAAPGIVHAATVSVEDGVLHFAAEPDQRNLLTVEHAGDEYDLRDLNARILPGAGCVAGATKREASCADTGVTRASSTWATATTP
jgi:hypothetical protein